MWTCGVNPQICIYDPIQRSTYSIVTPRVNFLATSMTKIYSVLNFENFYLSIIYLHCFLRDGGRIIVIYLSISWQYKEFRSDKNYIHVCRPPTMTTSTGASRRHDHSSPLRHMSRANLVGVDRHEVIVLSPKGTVPWNSSSHQWREAHIKGSNT